MNHIVESARRMVGTPYHHQARLPGIGLDCVGLIIAVGRELGYLAPDYDITGYSRVPDGALLMKHLHDKLNRIEEAFMQPGDVVCVAFDQYPQHVGFLGDYRYGGLSIIHAASKHHEVVETRLMFTPAMRFVSAFRFKEAA